MIAEFCIILMLMRIATEVFNLIFDSIFTNHFRNFFEILNHFIFLFSHMVRNAQSIDSFHIVSAHAPNSLVPRYLREITLEGAALKPLPMHYTMEYEKR